MGFWAGTAKVNLNMPYVVKGVADRGQLVCVWGAPGSGKSFNMIEMLMCIGAGVWWRGRRVKRGVVIYVCAESTRAHIENRIAALIRERPELAAADVLVVPLALDLLHEKSGDVDRVIDTAKALKELRGEVVAIAIDTLERDVRGRRRERSRHGRLRREREVDHSGDRRCRLRGAPQRQGRGERHARAFARCSARSTPNSP